MNLAELVIPQEVRQRYLERRKKDLLTLKSALQSKCYDDFKRIGHQLKGNAASFGYLDLEKLAIQLENVSLNGTDSLLAAQLVHQFEDWLKSAS